MCVWLTVHTWRQSIHTQALARAGGACNTINNNNPEKETQRKKGVMLGIEPCMTHSYSDVITTRPQRWIANLPTWMPVSCWESNPAWLIYTQTRPQRWIANLPTWMPVICNLVWLETKKCLKLTKHTSTWTSNNFYGSKMHAWSSGVGMAAIARRMVKLEEKTSFFEQHHPLWTGHPPAQEEIRIFRYHHRILEIKLRHILRT